MLPRHLRVTDKFHFGIIKKHGKSAHAPSFILSILKDRDNPQAQTKFGVIVANTVDKSSVVRHRIRRLINEYFYKNLEKFGQGNMVVVVAKPQAVGKNYEDFSSEFNTLLSKVSIS